MTLEQARRLYEVDPHCDWRVHNNDERDSILKEMEGVVEAKSDRAGGETVLWWNCWDTKFTATGYARKVRQEWAKMKGGLT